MFVFIILQGVNIILEQLADSKCPHLSPCHSQHQRAGMTVGLLCGIAALILGDVLTRPDSCLFRQERMGSLPTDETGGTRVMSIDLGTDCRYSTIWVGDFDSFHLSFSALPRRNWQPKETFCSYAGVTF